MRTVRLWLLILTLSILGSAQLWAIGSCTSPVTNCLAKGHASFAATDFPYTEDIVYGSSDTPVPDPFTLNGPASTFTQIEGGCVDVSGLNLNGTQPFNALLRAMVQVHSTTAAVGARYEVQLVVDGLPYGWYVRRLRGVYPQFDVFTATATALSAGSHSYQVLARLLDTGAITVSNTYSSAFGSPTTYPSVKSVNSAQLTLATTAYQPVTNSVSFSSAQPVDFVVQGYFQVDSGVSGQTLSLAPFLDGVRQAPTTTIGLPPQLFGVSPQRYEGVNFLSILPNVPAGSHTLQWRVLTNGNTTVFSNREINGISFPASTYQLLAQSTSSLTVQSQSTPSGTQPTILDTACGYWTNLLSGTIPADSGSYNTIYEGFVRFTGATTGTSTFGQLWFESTFPGGVGTDGGNRGLALASYGDGVYLVGDAMAFGEPKTETISLWGRKVNAACGGSIGGYGTFDVSDRFIWVRHTPITPTTTCWYQ
ncbi:MAG TPA: hypothetical protein VGS07_01610 [Thermoanaerobaculia bacterium]|nr:hypothetical protein [Thermoanaerobaculia bacterium]